MSEMTNISPELNKWVLALGALQDGNLHLIAFLGDKFCYLIKDPKGSGWVIEQALAEQFPAMVRRMLADNE